MNRLTKIIQFVCALALAMSAVGISTSAALASRPDKYEYDSPGSYVLTDVCSFPVNIDSNAHITEIDFYNSSGALTRIFAHIIEQDTFTANGKTLVGIPFVFNVEVLFDSDGNVTHNYADGVTEKIPLPDGSLFISAGRADFTAHPGVMFLLSPDKGNPGNVAGFCAALTP